MVEKSKGMFGTGVLVILVSVIILAGAGLAIMQSSDSASGKTTTVVSSTVVKTTTTSVGGVVSTVTSTGVVTSTATTVTKTVTNTLSGKGTLKVLVFECSRTATAYIWILHSQTKAEVATGFSINGVYTTTLPEGSYIVYARYSGEEHNRNVLMIPSTETTTTFSFTPAGVYCGYNYSVFGDTAASFLAGAIATIIVVGLLIYYGAVKLRLRGR